MNKNVLFTFLVSISILACKNEPKPAVVAERKMMKINPELIDSQLFDTTLQGKQVVLLNLTNENGVTAQLTNYGARLVSFYFPDTSGTAQDVIVGPGSMEQFLKSTGKYFGATIGRYGNRIAKGRFTLDGKTYQLATNNKSNHLHGGMTGYNDVVWDHTTDGDSSVTFSYLSKDGEEGYPGNLNISVTYTLTNENSLSIRYEASTDQKTIVNLTNHAFFNLNGSGNGSILNNILQVFAQKYNPVDTGLIPTGIANVENTPFDFTQPTAIRARIDIDHEQLKNGKGYDHNFVLKEKDSKEMIHAATVRSPITGIVMEVYTQEPGLQFYSGNFMNGQNELKAGVDAYRSAFCLETQHFPDSPNKPDFPSVILDAGQKYTTHTIYKFRW